MTWIWIKHPSRPKAQSKEMTSIVICKSAPLLLRHWREIFRRYLRENNNIYLNLGNVSFAKVLSDLMVDESLEKFRLEYEKLHRALKKSHEQEKRLVKKCRELNSEILNNQAKIKTALRLSQEDQKTITHLQKEMEKTWKLGK